MNRKVLFLTFLISLMITAASLPVAAEEAGATGKGIAVLYTSDVHCGVDQGFGYEGLWQIRQTMEEEGYATILVDDGDSVQGEAIGTLTRGEAVIGLMNQMGYDAAIPGNHEFDYGTDQFLRLADMAAFPYISCNFTKNGELVFEPYKIVEAAGKKIAFVGVTTPMTFTTSTPTYFQDENGSFIYGFMQDETGQKLYDAVQSAVDSARKEGADYVYVLAHLGLEDTCSPWTYADVISHTSGIDVFLDGHSHDTEQVVMKNRDGRNVTRSAVGTKLNCIGRSIIHAEDGTIETDILSWPNSESAPRLLDMDNEMTAAVDAAFKELDDEMNTVVARSDVELIINDPEETDLSGNPIRMVRRAETNLGDLCADALREATGADIAILNGGGIRSGIGRGDITMGDILNVFPYNNTLCVVEATGQQILDALEWGARNVPDENGAFLQVSGLSYEIDSTVDSGCRSDENGMCTGIEGDRRVKKVRVGDEELDPGKTYSLAGGSYILIDRGDGFTFFENAPVLNDLDLIDHQALIDYLSGTLGGTVGEAYADPFGQGRITVKE
ncbi:MAG: bifunctional metallophosphatase/5'-nucleotidase [Lachnospiraceae bacterium]|nr:bifunctional metallophosphatase/5'-nucleotidase [Lachnospiraceae bacterium]